MLLALTACASNPASLCEHGGGRATLRAVHAEDSIQVDGRLEEAVWQSAPRYPMVHGRDRIERRPDYTPQPGTVQLAWDEQHLYVAARLEDRDVVAQGDADNLRHFSKGDTLEVFLSPADGMRYWEPYATPHGRQTVMRFEAPGRLGLAGNRQRLKPILSVAGEVDGTLNDPSDRDHAWMVEMVIPIAELTGDDGARLQAGNDWHILIGRYNHSRYIMHRGAELTMYPQLSRTSFHNLWEYGELSLEP